MTYFERQVRHASEPQLRATIADCVNKLERSVSDMEGRIHQATAGRVLSIVYNEMSRRGLEYEAQ
jgi:hypothetical protein